MAIKKEVVDELLAEAEGKDVFGKDGLLDDLKKALAERMLNAEIDHHLGQASDEGGGDRRVPAANSTALFTLRRHTAEHHHAAATTRPRKEP
jgi:putative transposase